MDTFTPAGGITRAEGSEQAVGSKPTHTRTFLVAIAEYDPDTMTIVGGDQNLGYYSVKQRHTDD